MTTPAVQVARARAQVDAVRDSFDRDLRMDVHAHQLLRAVELQQFALEAIVARLQQHYVGGQHDHPDLTR